MTRLLFLAPLLILAACENQPQSVTVIEPIADACHASQHQGLVGQKSAVLATAKLPEGTRIIKPNSAVTMDLRPDRLNVEINAKDIIAKVSCY